MQISHTIFIALFTLMSLALPAQTIPIGSVADENARGGQLLGKVDSSLSFAVRPLSSRVAYTDRRPAPLSDSAGYATHAVPITLFKKQGFAGLLPVSMVQQFNSHHPYGWNDGAMTGAKGYQMLIRAGAYISVGALEIQLAPEFVYAASPGYENNIFYGSNPRGTFRKVLPGQSHIQLSAGAFSVGMSSENLWWGPGIRSSLLMSNNAPGFLHGYFRSSRPAKTPIGTFEWQLIGGKLTSDNGRTYENLHHKFAAHTGGGRYLNAYVISYQPKWVPGLFLGMTRALQRYRQDISRSGTSILNKYIPVLTKAFSKDNAIADDTMRTDQLASFFMRWVLPKAKAEFYVEYGFNDYNQNLRDYLLSLTHSAAYTVGFKKVFTLTNGAYVDMAGEITQLSQSPDYLFREAGNWYVHGDLLQGYTHDNQILGAGAGLGSNVQSLAATWIKGWKQWGVLLERVEHDPIYHPFKWVDLSIGILPQWKYRNLVVSGKLQFINSKQYAWQKDVDRFNFHSRLGIQWLF